MLGRVDIVIVPNITFRKTTTVRPARKAGLPAKTERQPIEPRAGTAVDGPAEQNAPDLVDEYAGEA